MSRIGIQPIILPEKVTALVDGNSVKINGPLGELSETLPGEIKVNLTASQLTFERKSNIPAIRALHGLSRALVANMVEGVTKGFEKRLELVGTGYRATQSGAGLSLTVGFSHPVAVEPLPGITLKTEGNTAIVVTGISKAAVGQQAASIHAIRPPEPYNGKGIRYQGEVVRRKPGKAAKVASAA